MSGADRDGITFRWVDGPSASAEEWDRIEQILSARGWMSLNRATSRVLVAEDADGNMKGFHVFQMVPYCGPLFVVPSARGTGIAEELADKMYEFLGDVHVRGWLVTAESRHAAAICEKYGMTEVLDPVYVMPHPGGTEV